MPTYDYVCDKCGYEFEMYQSMKDDPIKKCPECKSQKARRLIGSGGGIIFKGSGFYETDYKRKSQPSSESKSENKSESKTESKSETKTENKSESKTKATAGAAAK
ncbi:MAG: zinc ribbon domain-containing protein [bacterium]|nr:zinc ribbon domain-containing protein [bacterium]